MTFIIYSRKSVVTERGDSIENQAEMCRQYIQATYPGHSDIAVYEDEGFSGKNLERPQFRQMMRDIRKKPPDCLVCYRLDRISRSVGDFAALIEELNRLGVAFVCIREKFDTGTPMGKAMMYIASVFAQLERETIAQRVRDNMLMLARTGRWLGGTPPTGYASEKVQEVILDGKIRSSCRLTPIPHELDVIALIYQLFLQQQSLNELHRELHRRNILTRSGAPYSLPALRDILQNPVYCTADTASLAYFTQHHADVCFTEKDAGRGLLAYNKRDYSKSRLPRNPVEKWIVAPGQHEGLISGRDWCDVQELLARNSTSPPPHNSYALLSGQITCAYCGKRMFAKNRSQNRGVYDYICQTKLHFGASVCGCPNLNGPHTDALVFQAIQPHILPDHTLLSLIGCLKHQLPSQIPVSHSHSKQVQALRRELEHLAEALGAAAPDSVFARSLLVRAAEVEASLHRLTCLPDRSETNAFPDFSPQALLQNLSLTEQRGFVRLLLRRCSWNGEQLHLVLHTPKLP